jgi:recombination protein RecA
MSKEKKEKVKAGKAVDSEKLKKLEALRDLVNKKFGDDSIMLMDKGSVNKKMDSVSTGSLQLDTAIGIGGIPVGRIVEIYGPEASGKTTLTLHVAAEVQKKGGTVAFIDAEHALDFGYAQKIGVNVPEVLLSQPNSGEEALDIAITLAESGMVDLIVIDSVAALTPKAELEGEMTDQQMGAQARMLGKALRKITGIASQNNCTVMFINQLRMKIGVMFGNPETTAGGNALKFFASLRMDIRKDSKTTEADGKVLGTMKVTIKKNKVAPLPKETIMVPVVLGEGIDLAGEVYNVAKTVGVVETRGGTNIYQGTKPVKLKDGSTLEAGQKFASKGEEAKAMIKREPNLFNQLRLDSAAKMDEILSGNGDVSVESESEEVIE